MRLTELLEVVGKADLLPSPDEPLRTVSFGMIESLRHRTFVGSYCHHSAVCQSLFTKSEIIGLTNGVSVVTWEFMMKVVISLSQRCQRRNPVVARTIFVIKWLLTNPMGQAVDAKSCLLDEKDAANACIHKTTNPIVPEQAGDERGKHDAHEERALDVMAVLEDDNGVFVEVRNVGAANAFGVLVQQNPSHLVYLVRALVV